MAGAPGQEGLEVRPSVQSRLSTVVAQVYSNRRVQTAGIGRTDGLIRKREGSQTHAASPPTAGRGGGRLGMARLITLPDDFSTTGLAQPSESG
jgi:hypothetical protein